MVIKNGKSPVRQKLDTENFEDKYDRRLEFHETLRNRHNTTSCRQDNPCWNKEQERHSPREQEFFRRRHLWTDESGDKGVRSPPKSNKYIKHSSIRENFIKVDNKDEDVSTSCQISWHHNRSKTYPFDSRIAISEFCLEPVHSKTKKNDVTTRERGVQTIQETPKICLKKDSSQQTDCAIAVLNGELLQLSEYLMEALHREQKLKKKLCALQELLSVLVQASEKSWMTQLNEDHLKCKVANLENQLFFYTQSFPKTNVKKLLLEMEDHKMKYEEKAKESLQKLSEEKIATQRQLQNVEMSLSMSSEECVLWKEEYEKLKADWIELSNKHCELKNEMNILHSKLQWVGSQESQCQQLYSRIQQLQKEQIELQALNEHLQEDNDLQKEQLSSLQVRLRNSEEQKLEMHKQIKGLQLDLVTLEHKNVSDIKRDTTTLQLSESPEELKNDQLQAVMEKLASQEKECAGLKVELDLVTDEYRSCQRKLKQCREELKGMSRKNPKRCCCFWTPLFTVILAAVMAFFFSSHIEHYMH
ncbi:TRAF3-interacting JNK-activating modulator isoform X1 [Bufo bufo]|uniref:TRAF3-interacting JNK-activating modulator isoform X1 n=1 Tax=Bufo bufo TaxID=8384 RepID=UPI001ABEDDE2|nr:TRAF3-interacting JNK-activating modulator isoform X1 [Bufo bufo]XP_040279949.1 TRAF3-interacting JNK-activating modulator isoform X1 [Bufo bufo]XP_040279950.1 TRAF3-interacting JNK-activating modulator isoform X1 [Bufo bufo]XP_040279951.1 TRAF3-interacting JNK-activating modulator isoform X1 [Bufo bufo]XP_040279952.1 TRAF3-interacting JNK-activating modulator isoform X1 [Bufo bufo]XP_040279953.1 TRAF3-interacting JNK-activating modulator isoform X1 [Bufo bufo]